MVLSRRLMTVLDLVRKCEILADIGTDHGFLPIEACNMWLCEKAISCDINKGPLEVAKANIAAAGLSQRIETRLGDGLRPLGDNEADCIVISGMGGMRIWSILQAEPKKASFAKKLVLGPQHNIPELRKNLHGMRYEIFEEKLVYEDSRFYVILAAAHTGKVKAWTEQEYYLGKYLHNSENFVKYLRYHEEQITGYIDSLNHHNSRQLAEKRLSWIREFL